ncbi:hypothetical protein UT300012_21750 [Paraclostridium bifermentans]
MVDKGDVWLSKFNFKLAVIDFEDDLEQEKALGTRVYLLEDKIHLSSLGRNLVINLYKTLHKEFMSSITGTDRDNDAMCFLDKVDNYLVRLRKEDITINEMKIMFKSTLDILDKYDNN